MFDRLLKVINSEDFKKIKNAKILIIGIGGVGGSALESLVRIGISNITIVDNDIVEESNLNRQIISLHSNIGKYKVDVAKKRLLDINPTINIKTNKSFITKDNIDELFKEKYDYIIDACDTVTTKVLLIKYAKLNNIDIISCMGSGNRIDPTKLEIIDIYKTSYDPLAKVMRNLLKKEGIKKQKVIYSKEIPVKTKDSTPGSTSLVPNVAGIYAASYIINKILES